MAVPVELIIYNKSENTAPRNQLYFSAVQLDWAFMVSYFAVLAGQIDQIKFSRIEL
jgi:hypothetical protein